MISTLIRNITYPLNNIRIASPEGTYLKQLEKSQFLPQERLCELQWKKIKKLLDHAYENVPYYQRKLEESGIRPTDIKDREDYAQLPILTRSELNENLPELKAKNHPKNTLIPDYSGGSSGEPVKFYKTKKFNEFAHACGKRHDRWSGWDIGEKTCYLWGAPRDIPANPHLKDKVFNTFLYRRLMLNAFQLTEEKMSAYCYKIQRFKPKFITAYPHSLSLLSKYIKEKTFQG